MYMYMHACIHRASCKMSYRDQRQMAAAAMRCADPEGFRVWLKYFLFQGFDLSPSKESLSYRDDRCCAHGFCLPSIPSISIPSLPLFNSENPLRFLPALRISSSGCWSWIPWLGLHFSVWFRSPFGAVCPTNTVLRERRYNCSFQHEFKDHEVYGNNLETFVDCRLLDRAVREAMAYPFLSS